MHSRRMGLGPVNAAAAFTLAESIVAGEDVGRHSSPDQLARDRNQHGIASRASRERNRARVEAEAFYYLAQLGPYVVALHEENVARSSEALVACEQHSAIRASNLEQRGAGEGGIGDNVGAEQPEPSREPHQHPVGGESGSFIHRSGL